MAILKICNDTKPRKNGEKITVNVDGERIYKVSYGHSFSVKVSEGVHFLEFRRANGKLLRMIFPNIMYDATIIVKGKDIYGDIPGHRSRIACVFLSVFLGFFGAPYFYMGQIKAGILVLILGVISVAICQLSDSATCFYATFAITAFIPIFSLLAHRLVPRDGTSFRNYIGEIYAPLSYGDSTDDYKDGAELIEDFTAKASSKEEKKPHENKKAPAPPRQKHRVSDSSIRFASNGYLRRYGYKSVELIGTDSFDFDISSIELNKNVYFEADPENEADKNSIKVFYDDESGKDAPCIGYLPHNRLQSIATEYLSKKNRIVAGLISEVNEDTHQLWIHLGFYMPIQEADYLDHVDAVLVGTSKKDWLDVPRRENLEYKSTGESVCLEYQIESETYLVTDECGSELGEIGKTLSTKLQEEYGDDSYDGIIQQIEHLEPDKIKCKIRIYTF